jgi:lipid A 3-O-deacylase
LRQNLHVDGKVERDLRRIHGAAFLLLLPIAGVLIAAPPPAAAQSAQSAQPADADNFPAQIRIHQNWEYGPFLDWGTGVGNRSDFKFFWGGFDLLKPLSPVVHAGIFSGQFEYGGNIQPLWQAYTPPPHVQTFYYPCDGGTCSYAAPEGGGTFRGVSIMPVIFRWNFVTPSHRVQPWFQAAGGLIYTTHKFPPDQLVPHGVPGGTCVWNFSPQGGIGAHFFTSARRSIDVGVNGVHISSASLGDRNPGVNASVQVQVGYTFWK